MKKLSLISFLCLALNVCQAHTDKNIPNANPSSQAQSSAPIVCIDPGHPSETSAGNVVQNDTTEVHVAWMVALKLRALLEARGIRAVMTKTREDQLVKNKDRAMAANDAAAAVMVRLHCDASADSGFALYYPDRQGTVDGVTGPSADVIERSRKAAEAIHQGMREVLKDALKDGGVRGDSKTLVGSRQGALTGSIYSRVPAVTIEMVVLSNKADAEFIKAERGQQQMAEAIATGIERFVK
ncbi:MAG: N-acetylmuramoyl-L-alanine amidase [Acidobacteriota bacterium]